MKLPPVAVWTKSNEGVLSCAVWGGDRGGLLGGGAAETGDAPEQGGQPNAGVAESRPTRAAARERRGQGIEVTTVHVVS